MLPLLILNALLGASPATTLASAPSALGPVSSHREAPQITELPKLDATDFYLFRSYEAGREGYVTIVANYQPLQDPYGGPNYFTLDPQARYEIHIDNNGDAKEDLTFRFRVDNQVQDLSLAIGQGANQSQVAVPLTNIGPITVGNDSALNVKERYKLELVYGDSDVNSGQALKNALDGTTIFTKPVDNIGKKSLPDYEGYAAQYQYSIALPGGFTGRVFVGQRKDPFVVNLGETFDLVNTNPLGPVNGEVDDLADANVTSFILELPIRFLVDQDAVIGGWTTASLRAARVAGLTGTPLVAGGDPFLQVSRLSNPLVNELVIGLKDKDKFNASEPQDDGQFATYVTNPTLPALLEVLFGVKAPTAIPRADLVAAFLTGVQGLNVNGSTAEMLRLNTAIAPVPLGQQNNLGVIGGDVAGFPNGRRPGDDVVDIALRVVMGVLLAPVDAPDGQLPYTDGAYVDATFFENAFPYLKTPLAGSPN